jgi:hypothetical protein
MKKICVALMGFLCLPLPVIAAGGLRLYSDIERDWAKIYGNSSPKLEGLFETVSKLTTQGSAGAAGTVTGGGWGDDEEVTVPTAPKTTVVFPVHSFPSEHYALLLGTSSDLAILQTKIGSFARFGPQGDQTVTDPVTAQAHLNEMKHAIELERAVIAFAFYMSSPTLAEKCRHAQDLRELFITLQSRSPFTSLPSDWNRYESAVKAGIDNAMKAIPADICKLRTVVNKAQTDQWLSQAIDDAVNNAMKTHLQAYASQIAENNAAIGRTWKESETDVSLRPLFSVQRGFQNAIDTLNLVSRDLNRLASKDPNGGGDSMLDQLANKASSFKNGSPTSISVAEADLKIFRSEVSKFLMLLKSLPSTPGLGALTSCEAIDPQGDFRKIQEPIQNCLTQLVGAYDQNTSTAKPSDPALESFAQFLNQIMSKHLKQWE